MSIQTTSIYANTSHTTEILQGAFSNTRYFYPKFSSSDFYSNLVKNCYISKITLEYSASFSSTEGTNSGSGSITIKKGDTDTSFSMKFNQSKKTSIDLTNLCNSNNTFDSIEFAFTKSVWEATDNIFTYNVSGVKLVYEYIGPITLGISPDSTKGTVSKKLNNIKTGSVTVTATPVDGYHFVSWPDGNTSNPRTVNVSGSVDFTATIKPNTHTLNFYDSTSGKDILYGTLVCSYDDIEQLAPQLPDHTPPEGYLYNPIGWCASKDGMIREGTSIIKDFSGKELTQYTAFQNYTSSNNAVLNFYCNFYPKEYYIYYKHFKQNSTSNYTISTGSRAYQRIAPLKSLPTANQLSEGYKLSNQVAALTYPVDNTITNSWFVSSDAMQPGDPKIISIDPNLMGDTTVFCYEVPIIYRIQFHLFDESNTLLRKISIQCTYNVSAELPPILESQIGKGVAGWYTEPATNIQDWYLEPNSETDIANDTIPPMFPANKVINATKEDQATIDLYGYYVPKSYLLEYKWLDNWGQGESGFELPVPGMWIYGKDPVSIATIPTNFNEYYDVENQGTINWYYKDASGNLVTNIQTELPPIYDHNITFYAVKEPKGRTITVSSNRADWGTAYVRNPKEGNQYEEGDEVEIYAVAADGLTSYFSHWEDGDNHPVRKVKVGSYHKNYKAIFRSLQIFAPVNHPINDNVIILLSNDEYILFDRNRLRLISDEEEKNND